MREQCSTHYANAKDKVMINAVAVASLIHLSSLSLLLMFSKLQLNKLDTVALFSENPLKNHMTSMFFILQLNANDKDFEKRSTTFKYFIY